MPALNYAEEYKQALANAYPYALHFGALFTSPNNAVYKTTDAKTIQIPTLSVTGMTDGDRDSIGTAARNYNNAWETKELANHRNWSTLVHPMDINQTNMAASIANITKTFNETQKFPEMDSYLVSALYAAWTATGKSADETALTTANILNIFDNYMADMDDKNTPQNGRLLYVTPATYTLLKNSANVVRNIYIDKGRESEYNRLVSRLDEVEIIKVPSSKMKTLYNFTTGCVADETAGQINMFLVHPTSILTPVNYTFASLDEPTAMTQGKYFYFEEMFYDAFILNQRADGLMFNITPYEAPQA
jgi:hypothetical protein